MSRFAWKNAPIALLLGLVVVGSPACGDENTTLGGGRSSCDSKSWRAATPGYVVCPGALNCECAAGEVCCVAVVNNRATSGSCGALSDCKGPALTCDGTEDCPTGQICCLVDAIGGGSSCRAPSDCFFTDENPMCRDETECDGIEHCTPSPPGAYLAGVAAACTL